MQYIQTPRIPPAPIHLTHHPNLPVTRLPRTSPRTSLNNKINQLQIQSNPFLSIKYRRRIYARYDINIVCIVAMLADEISG